MKQTNQLHLVLEVRNAWSYTSTPLFIFMAWYLTEHRNYAFYLQCVDIVLNLYAPNEDKSGDTKDSFYKEQKHVYDQFPTYHMELT
jgi:hypothetical protein